MDNALDIMVDCVNRHSGEYNTFGQVESIAEEIADELYKLGPADCDVLMATECFVAVCLRKQLAPDDHMYDRIWVGLPAYGIEIGYPKQVTYSKDSDKYDQYITYESKEALRVLTSLTVEEIEAGLAIRKV